MTRRVPTANGVHTNGDVPPPSTLAAQIVQNQTRPAPPQQNGEKVTFAELLHEILHDRDATPETDIRVNVKLINVVAEAGLAPLADGNPFAQWDILIPQAIDSIAVIESTIKRQPEVIITSISSDGPLLLLPLIARLAAVCGRFQCEDLPVVRLLDSVFRVLKSSLDLWQYANTLRQVLQECVDGTLKSSCKYAPAHFLSQNSCQVWNRRLHRTPNFRSSYRLPEVLHSCGRSPKMRLLFLTVVRLLLRMPRTPSYWRWHSLHLTSYRQRGTVKPSSD